MRNLRIAPRKVRLVADLVRGKNVREAERVLRLLPNASALPMAKVLKSAVANALQTRAANAADLTIVRLLVNEGTKLKRFMPRSRGQASPIQKKTSHILLELGMLATPGALEKSSSGVREAAGESAPKKDVAPKEPKRSARIAGMKKDETKSAKPPTMIRRIFRRKSI